MSRLKRHWARGLKAGDLVYHQKQDGEKMAEVMEFLSRLAVYFPGMVPIFYVQEPWKEGLVWVPADDLEILVST